MKVKEMKTGRVLETNRSYGLRLIEQGKAVIFREPAAKAKAAGGTAARKTASADMAAT